MRVFISWSGARAQVVAEALREWLVRVIQRLEPWVSSADIRAGARWQTEISEILSNTKVGILCLTPENLNSPWLNFEAGALAKAIDDATYVRPYLIGLDPAAISLPIGQFQAKRADREGTKALVKTINSALKDGALPETQLYDAFETYWPRLWHTLESLPTKENEAQHRREPLDLLEEILQIARGLARDRQPPMVDQVAGLMTKNLERALDQITDRVDSVSALRSVLVELEELRTEISQIAASSSKESKLLGGKTTPNSGAAPDG